MRAAIKGARQGAIVEHRGECNPAAVECVDYRSDGRVRDVWVRYLDGSGGTFAVAAKCWRRFWRRRK